MKPNPTTIERLLPLFRSNKGAAWLAGAAVLLALFASPCAQAEDFHAGFDDDATSWKVNYEKSQVELLSHRRHLFIFVHGRASENFELDASVEGEFVQLEHALPQARVFEELKLSLWVRSNRPGAALFVRIVFPHQIDPGTGKVLHTFLRGETYSSTGRWQKLTCATPQRQIDEQLRQIRARFKETRIDPREAYVDRAYVTTRLEKGTTEFFLDELTLGPLVEAQTKPDVLQVAEEGDGERSPAEFRLDRLRVEGVPFFPRIVPYHGEPPQTLSRARANVVWVPHLEDAPLIDSLRREGLWITATPPRPEADPRPEGKQPPTSDDSPEPAASTDENVEAAPAAIPPFGAETMPVLFWNLGLQIPADARDELVDWKRRIQDADAAYQRPLLADVDGLENVYSRHVDMLGMSRFPIGSSLTPMQYRDWLIQKRKTARHGSFIWTWIQTEIDVPSGPSNAGTAAAQRGAAAQRKTVPVEPEQMRMQTYAALAAGCRGIGFWKTDSLNSDDPAALERRLALAQLNLELELLEPWLATGTVVEHVPFAISQPSLKVGQRGVDFKRSRERSALLKARDYESEVNARRTTELEATIIRSDYGMLLLPVWYHRTAFFVPSQMAANDATIVVRGVDETASAWQISTTGIRSLERERITGGVKITLPKFDQTAAVVLTSDPALVAKIRRKVDRVAEQSARLSIDLVRARLDRVRQVDSELERLGVGQLDAPQLLSRATTLLANAETAFRRQDYHGARQTSDDAAQLLRILQSVHWYDAVRSLASPTAGPFTVCFQTLPDHWQLMAYLGRTQFNNDADILYSGDFEDIHTMIADGWKHTQNEIEGVKAAAELYPVSDANYALRLVAVPDIGREPPRVVDSHPVTVTTPPLPVHAGQIVHVSGRIRVIGPITGSIDGVMLYDNQSGRDRALRWHSSTGWRQFELLRKIERNSDFQLTIALTGLGEAQFDDIRVVPHTPRVQTAAASGPSTADAREQPWDFMPRIPKWSNPLPGIQNSLPKLGNPIPKLNDALPRWNYRTPQTPVPDPPPAHE